MVAGVSWTIKVAHIAGPLTHLDGTNMAYAPTIHNKRKVHCKYCGQELKAGEGIWSDDIWYANNMYGYYCPDCLIQAMDNMAIYKAVLANVRQIEWGEKLLNCSWWQAYTTARWILEELSDKKLEQQLSISYELVKIAQSRTWESIHEYRNSIREKIR